MVYVCIDLDNVTPLSQVRLLGGPIHDAFIFGFQERRLFLKAMVVTPILEKLMGSTCMAAVPVGVS
jgi:hypothetical protein